MKTVQIIQAATAFVVGIFITFSQAHDANLAMTGLLILTIGWFAAALVAVIKNQKPFINGFVVLATAAMVYTVLTFGADANNATTRAWILLMAWGLCGAIVELIYTFTSEKKSAEKRDHLINVVLAAGLLISINQVTAAGDSVSRVGFFGAYAILMAVHLGISAASPRTASKA